MRWAIWTKEMGEDGLPLKVIIIDDVPDDVTDEEFRRVAEKAGWVDELYGVPYWAAQEFGAEDAWPAELPQGRADAWCGEQNGAKKGQAFALRMPRELHRRVKREAQRQGCSMNDFILRAALNQIADGGQ